MNAQVPLYQFARMEIYPIEVSGQSKIKSSRRTVNQIINEASRLQQYCTHIKRPFNIRHLEGCQVHEIPEKLASFLDENPLEYKPKPSLAPQKRKSRIDSPVLLAAVYSYPEPIDSFDEEKAVAYFMLCLLFHRRWFKRVDSAVIHLDEAYPHIHVYSFSNNAKALHPGHAAKKLAKDDGLTGSDLSSAYKKAMINWQDDFHSEVGQQFELARVGPKRKRMDRHTHLKSKELQDYALQLADEKSKRKKLEAEHIQASKIIEDQELNIHQLTEQLKNAQDLVRKKEALSLEQQLQIQDLEKINAANQDALGDIAEKNLILLRHIHMLNPDFDGEVSSLDDYDDSSEMRM